VSGTILIATDGSPEAFAAANTGLKIARAESASVIFVHAEREVAKRLFEDDPYAQASPESVMQVDPVLGAAAKLALEWGVSFELEVIGAHGADAVADAILGIAAGRDAELIVIGSRGRGAVVGTVLGSVSHEVLKFAETPVLVVHSPKTGDD
jgi:nucleotide-binding universal stress UspA family protein